MVLATLGLALNVLLWSVPGFVAASGAAQSAHRGPNSRPSVPVAMVGLLGAELDAVRVAGVAIENPRSPHLGETADRAGGRVLAAVRVYVAAFEASFSP
jgi:hypothetical protein